MKGTGDEEEKKRQNIFIHFLETKIPGGRERKNKTKEKEKIVFIFDSYSRKVHVVLCVCVLQKSFEKGLPTDAAWQRTKANGGKESRATLSARLDQLERSIYFIFYFFPILSYCVCLIRGSSYSTRERMGAPSSFFFFWIIRPAPKVAGFIPFTAKYYTYVYICWEKAVR